ncbi:hypothetical protein Tco_0053633 [Tanacetum coccineum]
MESIYNKIPHDVVEHQDIIADFAVLSQWERIEQGIGSKITPCGDRPAGSVQSKLLDLIASSIDRSPTEMIIRRFAPTGGWSDQNGTRCSL